MMLTGKNNLEVLDLSLNLLEEVPSGVDKMQVRRKNSDS